MPGNPRSGEKIAYEPPSSTPELTPRLRDLRLIIIRPYREEAFEPENTMAGWVHGQESVDQAIARFTPVVLSLDARVTQLVNRLVLWPKQARELKQKSFELALALIVTSDGGLNTVIADHVRTQWFPKAKWLDPKTQDIWEKAKANIIRKLTNPDLPSQPPAN